MFMPVLRLSLYIFKYTAQDFSIHEIVPLWTDLGQYVVKASNSTLLTWLDLVLSLSMPLRSILTNNMYRWTLQSLQSRDRNTRTNKVNTRLSCNQRWTSNILPTSFCPPENPAQPAKTQNDDIHDSGTLPHAVFATGFPTAQTAL